MVMATLVSLLFAYDSICSSLVYYIESFGRYFQTDYFIRECPIAGSSATDIFIKMILVLPLKILPQTFLAKHVQYV